MLLAGSARGLNVKLIKFLIKLGVSVSIIVYLFKIAEFDLVAQRLGTAEPKLVLTATFLLFTLLTPQAYRWRNLVQALGFPFNFLPAFAITLVGAFFNQVLPSSVGGDTVRIWYVRGYSVPFGKAAQSVIFDRVSALVAMTIMLLASTPWLNLFVSSEQAMTSIIIAAVLLLLCCVGFLTLDYTATFLLPDSWKQRVIGLVYPARSIFLSRIGGKLILLSLLIHISVAGTVWLLALSMGIELKFSHALVLMPIILFISSIPISIAGWGLRESAMVTVFGMVGMPAESALAVSVGFGLMMLVSSLPGGIVWWFMHHQLPDKTLVSQVK